MGTLTRDGEIEMRNIMRKAALAASSVAIVATAASAQTFTGSTAFCFSGPGAGTPACPTYGAPGQLGGLTLAAGSFSVTTNSGGFAAIGGIGNNLGMASLTATPFTYAGNTVQLRVTFTAPAGASQSTFSSLLTGSVEAGPTGGAIIEFAPSTLPGTYGSGATAGTYQLSVDRISLTPGQTGVEITGAITSVRSTVPEPSTYALMISGLAGLGMVARRRRSNV